jgi:hypothetical protein
MISPPLPAETFVRQEVEEKTQEEVGQLAETGVDRWR